MAGLENGSGILTESCAPQAQFLSRHFSFLRPPVVLESALVAVIILCPSKSSARLVVRSPVRPGTRTPHATAPYLEDSAWP